MASAYGWTKQQILETIYPDEIEHYTKRIRREKINERLALLAVVHNPHVQDPKKLIADLQKEASEDDGKYYEKERMSAEDVRQLDEIKRLMRDNAQKRKSR